MSAFREHLRKALRHYLGSWHCRHVGNDVDTLLTGSDRESVKDRKRLQEMRIPSFAEYEEEQAGKIDEQDELKSFLYDLLADDYSRETLVTVAAFSLLGKLFVKFPYYRDDAPSTLKRLHRSCLCRDADPETVKKYNTGDFTNLGATFLYDASSLGLPARLYASRVFLYALSGEHDYRYDAEGTVIDVRPGATVLDCGAAFGDTSLLFAHKAGKEGRVVSFEPNPFLSLVLHDNLQLNPGLAERVSVVENAVGRVSGEVISFALSGVGSQIAGEDYPYESPFKEMATLSIDDCAAAMGLGKVDFIKMDIEGAELPALQGTVKTLVRHKPDLAVCVYHKPDDYLTIPGFINSLDLGYRFYLKHHFMNEWETVLYARA